MGIKDALAEKTENKSEVKLTKSMSISDLIKAMGWGTSLWMNWKQKKRRDRSHAKSSPLRELLQILFYGNSATGNALLHISLLSVAFGRVRPGGHTLFFVLHLIF